jgi:hypothetical protein
MSADFKRWRVEYYPASVHPRVTEWVFRGTKADLDAWFLEGHVCESCKHDMAGGSAEHEVWLGGQMIGTEISAEEPYDDPWATPCGCEYGYEEIV